MKKVEYETKKCDLCNGSGEIQVQQENRHIDVFRLLRCPICENKGKLYILKRKWI